LLYLGLGLASVVATWVVAMLAFDPPRGVAFWWVAGFLTAAEMLGTLLASHAAVWRSGPGPSGAALGVVGAVFLVWVLVGAASIGLFLAFRESSGLGDGKFAALVLIECTVAFLVAALFYGHDVSVQLAAAPTRVVEAENGDRARRLRSAAESLRNRAHPDHSLRSRLFVLAKRLDSLEATLRQVRTPEAMGGSANGGGTGVEIDALLAELLAEARAVANGADDAAPAGLERVEVAARRLESTIREAGLA
jgi:hypothetical protein